MTGCDALIVSILPRGQPHGEPALVALSSETLELVAYREFPRSEFLANEATGEPSRLRHCRGLAAADARLFASLFNAVAEYRVVNPRELNIELVGHWSAPAAVDLHGLCFDHDRLFAASTGSGSLIVWDLASRRWTSITLDEGESPSGDLRFPDQDVARDISGGSWRRQNPDLPHLNDVTLLPDGRLITCSLNAVWMTDPASGTHTLLHRDSEALFHDGRPLAEDAIVLTDGARGDLVFLQLGTSAIRRLRIGDPACWFVRGVFVAESLMYVLSSEVTANGQLSIPDTGPPTRRAGSRFRITAVSVDDGSVLAERIVVLDRAAEGAAAYAVCLVSVVAHRPPPSSSGVCDGRRLGAA